MHHTRAHIILHGRQHPEAAPCSSQTYDLVVIGGGPAGVAGALKAAQLGKRAIVVDKPKLAPVGGGLDFGFGGPTGLCRCDDVSQVWCFSGPRDAIARVLRALVGEAGDDAGA